MNIKKIGIASTLGFLTQFAVGAVPMVLFYGPHGADTVSYTHLTLPTKA